MKRASLYLLLPLVVAVLLLNIPSGTVLVERVDVLVIYGLLTALALYFGVLLDDRTQLSSAHGMGMLAFLSLPATAFPANARARAMAPSPISKKAIMVFGSSPPAAPSRSR